MRLALLVLAACGAPPVGPTTTTTQKPAEPTPGPARIDYHHDDPVAKAVAVPRPDLRLPPKLAAVPPPDPSDHLRWPLTANSHPALEPTFAIAPVFATAGVSWADLCRLGAQNRRTSGALTDHTEYLKAWCDVGRREIAAAVQRLGPLLRSTALGLPAAVRIDIANILVDAGDADQAQRILAAAKIADLAVLDTLAASYIEVGRVRDGAMLNSVAIGSYDFQRPADQCERLTRRLLMARDTQRTLMVADYDPYLGNRGCALLAHEVACWLLRSCSDYLTDQGLTGAEVPVLNLYFTWPEGVQNADTWWNVGEAAYRLVPTSGADELAVAAYEGAMRSDNCRRNTSRDIWAHAHRIKRNKGHIFALDPRLDTLIYSPWLLCEAPKP